MHIFWTVLTIDFTKFNQWQYYVFFLSFVLYCIEIKKSYLAIFLVFLCFTQRQFKIFDNILRGSHRHFCGEEAEFHLDFLKGEFQGSRVSYSNFFWQIFHEINKIVQSQVTRFDLFLSSQWFNYSYWWRRNIFFVGLYQFYFYFNFLKITPL